MLRLRWPIATALMAGRILAGQYVGDGVCGVCHASEAAAFRETGMGRSMSWPSLDDAVGEFRHPATVAGRPGVSYSSSVRDGKVVHEAVYVSDNQRTVESHEVLYSLGSGEHGRSYLIARGGRLFMSPISYYTTTGKWDLSPGYADGVFRDFTRPVAASCLFCHVGAPDDPSAQIAIGCERCHGPGGLHVQRKSRDSIVNPARLSEAQRDDVCNQCHLSGDIRVLCPGKVETDYRPGTLLADTVAIFSMPPEMKPGGLDAVGHVGQLKMSRCLKASQGKIGCITCHDPHREMRAAEAVAYYRSRCLECHKATACPAPARERRATSPADNCIACHMPKSPLNRVAHISHTNHSIPRNGVADPDQPFAAALDLSYQGGGEPDPRTKALAYAEAARLLPIFAERARRSLEASSRAHPDDPDVQTAFGLVLRRAASAQARTVLERALALGSKSLEVRMALAGLLDEAGEIDRAIRLEHEVMQMEPYDAAPYLSLARIYLRRGDWSGAAQLADRVRSFDPGHPALAQLDRDILRRENRQNRDSP
jgi:hypothetical protein